MVFYIFKCSSGGLFGATDDPAGAKLPASACDGGEWKLFKAAEESGGSRIAFSETQAKADIEKQGFYLFRPVVQFNERVA